MSTVAETGGMERRLALAEMDRLPLRIQSAMVLGPLPIAAIWFGSPWLPLLTGLAAAVMAWEWGRLCQQGHFGETGVVLVGVVLAVVATAALLGTGLAIAAAAVGAVAVFWIARKRTDPSPRWTALGALWVALPCVCLLWLAREGAVGRVTLLWVLAVVWTTDVGAYAIGGTLGGPRLAPRWSPGKTWAGLVGGMVGAALPRGVTAACLGIVPAPPVILISAGLAVVEQFGDLAESLAKRRFGVKDTSGLIPGHGGLLDRLDGLLAVVPGAALLTVIGGRSLLEWQ